MDRALTLPRPPGQVAVAGHFGEWLQGRLGPTGPVVLVTLAAPGLRLSARRVPGTGLGLHCAGSPPLPPLVLRRFLAALGLPARGRFAVWPALPPGMGTGVSTATLLAVARLSGSQAGPQALARACIAAEGASDPLMFAHPDRLLWASRLGVEVAALPPVPRAHVVGGLYGPASATDPQDSGYDDISDLAARWRRGGDLADLAALASESATRCSARRGPPDDPTPALARRLGALGWVRSHSGAARGLIFPPGGVPPHAAAALREAGLRRITLVPTGG